MKKVSVVIPAYNNADLTVKTIESVLNQTYENIEIIVVDDGSTDNTKYKLKIFCDSIHYIYKNNGGASSARNVGIKQATGEYVALLDCDDIFYPEKIMKSVECLENNPDCGFVHTRVNYIDGEDNIISASRELGRLASGRILRHLLYKRFILNSTVVVKKECLLEAGYFDEKIFIPADWDMWLRLSEKYQAAYINDKLTGYRLTSSYTSSNMKLGLNESIYVLNKTFSNNNYFSKTFRKQCLSNIYLTYGLNYAVMKNFNKSRETLFKSFLNKPYSINILFILFMIIAFPVISHKLMLHIRPSKHFFIQQRS